MKRRQQQRHQERSLAGQAGPRPARRRPEWNVYLTDNERYKLNQQQQLQRQLQHLSTAHFSARTSPSHLASRRRMTAANAHSSDWSTPRDKGVSAPSSAHKNRSRSVTPTSSRRAVDTGVTDSVMKTARTLQFTDEAIAAADGQPQRRRGSASAGAAPTVSFQVDDEESEEEENGGGSGLTNSMKASLQGELAVLERMLWELEMEAENLSQQPTPQEAPRPQRQQEQQQKSPYRDGQPARSSLRKRRGSVSQLESLGDQDSHGWQHGEVQHQEDEKEERRESSDGEAEEEGQSWRESVNEAQDDEDKLQDDIEEDAETRLGDVCFKSLEIGLSLARKMDVLEKELDEERSLRKDQELKVEMLEQEVRSTHAKCNYLESKYQSVSSQLDGMRQAVSATEEAIHRMRLAFEQAQERPERVSRASTPGKKAMRSTQTSSTPRQTRRSATPKKSPMRMHAAAVEHQENWTPNSQQPHQRQHFE